jgi:hypothetical protein
LVVIFDAWYRSYMEKRLQIQKDTKLLKGGGS